MLGKTIFLAAIASQATPQKSRDYTKIFWHNPHIKLNFNQSCYFLLKLIAKSPPFPPAEKNGLQRRGNAGSGGQAGVAFDEVEGAGDLAAFGAFAGEFALEAGDALDD